MTKPTVPEVLPLVHALYRSEHGRYGGGCLHIVLDDRNVADDNVRFCIEWAQKEACESCRELGEVLLMMSKTQRLKLAAQAYKGR
jgi:hypothetical protein